MEYDFNNIEKKWQEFWAKNKSFKAEDNNTKPKYYVLDMFPYPSGAGLHVGHPLGYIASDIVSRYKRHKGFNVLHPMGYDSFGLPAEQYAIQTGQHPTITTQTNIKRYREQLDKLGFSFDWDREVQTSDPKYYKWTQWIFIQLFHSFYDNSIQKARPIDELIETFEQEGNINVNANTSYNQTFGFDQWNNYSEKEKSDILLQYRLTYLAEAEVNWCPTLGTVLANDEVINGVSERGGYPVIQKKMTQWMMRITAYAERLLQDLIKIDWPNPIKEAQHNWIGKSQGASITFKLKGKKNKNKFIEVFTTRPDTIFGVTFITLAPEHSLVEEITTDEYKEAVLQYKKDTAKRSERDRMADIKTVSGQFTGVYVLHPILNEPIPIWIGDYVLPNYGTGAVMAVPAGDQRDSNFAKHFNIPIIPIFNQDTSEKAFVEKGNFTLINSNFLNGLNYKNATQKIIEELEKRGIGKGTINYRLRDAVFSRQRYWGEPIPIYFDNGIPKTIPTKCLPLVLPEVEKYLPTETGAPPLGRAEKWAWDTTTLQVTHCKLINNKTIFPLELNTMPGWAGSSFYFNRYIDSTNNKEIFSKEANEYWGQVDLYLGGSEHATGHLLYSRFWQKFLYDSHIVKHDEYAKKLINQGMILGNSAFVYRVNSYETLLINEAKNLILPNNIFASNNLIKLYKEDNEVERKINSIYENNIGGIKKIKNINFKYKLNFTPIRIDISLINESDNTLDIERFKESRDEFKDAKFICEEDGKFYVSREVEKMSKSKYNVVSPDDICEQFGADTLRMYEMFLGPLEQTKPWNTQGLTGVYGFLKKFWKLYEYIDKSNLKAQPNELKILHQTIKKITEDIEQYSFNTSISQFMIATNELTKLGKISKEVLESICILISPFAPHIAEELWEQLGNKGGVTSSQWPIFNKKYVIENTKDYPISFNGKRKFNLELPLGLTQEEIEKLVYNNSQTIKELQGKIPQKFIFIEGKIINLVD